jgi:outer membrane protein assembly factor BamE (lipoprotein component of BamABCDE complex)
VALRHVAVPLLSGAALLCCGCSLLQAEYGTPFDAEQVAGLEPGRTGRRDVLVALGPPLDLAAHGDGMAFLYEHVQVDEWQLGVNLESLGADLFKFALGDSDAERETLVLLFDGDGILVDIGKGSWGEDVGTGSSFQFIAGVNEVVDSGPVSEGAPHLHWGFGLFEPPPLVLNQVHREDLQLRGTPKQAGQRALEQR